MSLGFLNLAARGVLDPETITSSGLVELYQRLLACGMSLPPEDEQKARFAAVEALSSCNLCLPQNRPLKVATDHLIQSVAAQQFAPRLKETLAFLTDVFRQRESTFLAMGEQGLLSKEMWQLATQEQRLLSNELYTIRVALDVMAHSRG